MSRSQPPPLPTPDGPAAPRRPRSARRLRWRAPGGRTCIAGLIVLVFIGLIVIASFLVDEPLRRMIERQMNERLKGYSAHIAKLSFHPLGLGVTLYGLTFSQNAHPDPAVLNVARLRASIQCR